MSTPTRAHGRCHGLLALCAAIACGEPDPAGSTTGQTSITSATSVTAGSSATTTAGDDGTTTTTAPPQTSGGVDGTTGVGPTSAATDTGDVSGSSGGADSSSTGAPSEHFMMIDPLIGGTMGTAVGGSFGDDGWTVTAAADRVYWPVPRLVEGSVEFTLRNVTLGNLPLNDHEVFAMYEGGHGIEHPIGYNPEFRNNAFKSMIRIYGAAELGREGQQKIMWGMCPFGAPGYHDGGCPCSDPAGFFEEPFGGDGTWDGSPQVLRIEWKDGLTRYLRNGQEVLSVDWTASGLGFGPDELYISLGNPRPLEVGTAGMPIGAVFSDLVVEGWTGPPAATCG
ncbi:MAG: hypothetical protein JNL82_18155 [Myxococcales bacterium]|nr:hypothetical protein [Myxococcales bacterium]